MVSKLPSWIGRMLRGFRAGIHKIAFNDPALAGVPATIVVESSAFIDGGTIPRLYSKDGDQTSPALDWRGVPTGTVSLVVLMEDADSPTPSPFVHLVAWGLPGCDGGVAAGVCNAHRDAAAGGTVPILQLGRNGMFAKGYTPPDPPPGHGPHRYLFQVYALDRAPDFRSTPGRRQLLRELRRGVLAKGQITGIYERR